jgi:hypothetical protein
MIDNVQEHNNCINIPLSQTFRCSLNISVNATLAIKLTINVILNENLNTGYCVVTFRIKMCN